MKKMSIISMLPQIIKESQKEAEEIKAGNFNNIAEIAGADDSQNISNILACGDNLPFMKYLLEGSSDINSYKGKIQLIYIDPPFFSKARYSVHTKVYSKENEYTLNQVAYLDIWNKGLYEYLKMLAVRFILMKELLSETGSIWVHLDWHVVHYAKVLLDEIFGEKNFVNEIIWNYKSGGTSQRHFARKHDTLLFYSKSEKYYFEPLKEKSYNRKLMPYSFKGVEEYEDEIGWYTMVNMKDVWPIDMVGRTSKERSGYATQKPTALLERIIKSCSREGDIVADFFGGSGSFPLEAGRLSRQWIYCDKGDLAIANAQKRFLKDSQGYIFKQEIPKKIIKQNLKESIIEKTEIDIIQDIVNKGEGENSISNFSNEEFFANYSNKNMTCEVNVTLKKSDPAIDVAEIIIKSLKIKKLKDLYLDNKSLEIVRKVLKTDPLAFLDFWQVDFDYDGKFFRPSVNILRENGRCKSVLELPLDIKGQNVEYNEKIQYKPCNVAVRIVDIFGNSVCKIINL